MNGNFIVESKDCGVGNESAMIQVDLDVPRLHYIYPFVLSGEDNLGIRGTNLTFFSCSYCCHVRPNRTGKSEVRWTSRDLGASTLPNVKLS